ncbi:hypothetical protein PUNSTDRAFT_133942 [Punctularia strigosozonata HHB-11173 SS5]|uniref:uncharacterized protein n=1 Tax=Punctularia strigosozonata (strain HHB-11173) TaxID=741275 RepID=UPI00044166DF|nr:uncharacterized protein PUNSTDRAFT_133942 [Punctularia strigosozonata HHB-11173 SS5]EIN08761.1 hypothetical protein PUNSTDRAFT_133942 [Punctularia strigosozonata HHB-11173 SS5]
MQSPQEFQPTPTTPGRIASSSPNQTRRLVDHKQDIVVTATPQTPTPRVPFSTPLTPPDSSKSRNSLVNTGGAAPDFQNSGQTNQLTTSIDLSQLSSALDSPLAQKSTGSLENTRSPELAALNVKVNAPSPPARTPQSDMSATPTTTEKPAPLEDHRTPNVYINGLPPNFAEEALYAMTKEFGTVISVRTFTRHVSDRPSGYGFVLFDSNDAAECCIESLRKYRNLHPSFSKAVHKIPGTVYAHVPATGSGKNTDPHSFKSKMERLKDESSTNLYMEG